MSNLSSGQRHILADRLRAVRGRVAEAVTDEFFRRHPEWVARYGERGRQRGLEDAGFHMDFLAGAVEAGLAGPFADYARWTVRVLAGRGIAPAFVAENLRQIGAFVLPQLTEEERAFVASLVEAACSAAAETPDPPGTSAAAGSLELPRTLFLQAILQGNRKAALAVCTEALRDGIPVMDVYVGVLQHALYEVGRLWEANRIAVAVEHMATAVAQFVMAQLYLLLPLAPKKKGNAVITGIEGELHQIGANMVADVLEAEGWNVRFLGTNLPHSGVLEAVEDHKADMVGVSATMLFNLPKVRRLIADIREKFPTRTPRILIGGGAFRSVPSPAATVEADGYGADLKSALALAG